MKDRYELESEIWTLEVGHEGAIRRRDYERAKELDILLDDARARKKAFMDACLHEWKAYCLSHDGPDYYHCSLCGKKKE